MPKKKKIKTHDLSALNNVITQVLILLLFNLTLKTQLEDCPDLLSIGVIKKHTQKQMGGGLFHFILTQ